MEKKISTYTLAVSQQPSLRFRGCKLGEVSTEEQSGYWTELAVYQTKSGKYICHRAYCTRWYGQQDDYDAVVVDNPDGVITFFGHNNLAHRLYDLVDIDYATEID